MKIKLLINKVAITSSMNNKYKMIKIIKPIQIYDLFNIF